MTSRIVKDFDWSKFQELQARINSMRGKDVVVGVTRATAVNRENPGEINNAELAAVHEFGSKDGTIPERSFIRSSMTNNRDEYVKSQAANLRKVVRGDMAFGKSLDLLGLRAAADVRDNIRRGDFEALKAATIKRKGSSAPLIDTGNLRQSITHEVRDAD